MLVLRSMGGSLTQLIGSDSAYAGISELCRLSENQDVYKRQAFHSPCISESV